MKLSDFDYYLPNELIAQEPVSRRDTSRLMVLPLRGARIEHRHFKDLIDYLKPDDTLVINETRVIPARLFGIKEATGAAIEVLILKRLNLKRWEALVRPGKKAPIGTKLFFGDGLLEGLILSNTSFGGRVIEFSYQGSFEEILEQIGVMPLPPYIKKPLIDQQRYQTIYARQSGSAAAPTAGLHFSKELLEQITDTGVTLARVLLHVGLGTFRPVQVEDIREHHMHAEYYEISDVAAASINETKKRQGRLIAVGTTTTRCLESAAGEDGLVRPGPGWTEIFIYPGYRFKVVEGLITNFHLPKSTLLMMVSALAGRDKILAAYQEAVRLRYRFFSFGDAMLII
ncbi:MAG: tRNA preQ1(34) S-adenosylmethionine ribosyltransferase-isomerase QueA [Desulfotomaculaceae bacterium]|nr:tRNA preQ1(34) S-adenosylmethionine ribosyltransferase-isomerase QueA [Desulfotomaculaceae bacterium]